MKKQLFRLLPVMLILSLISACSSPAGPEPVKTNADQAALNKKYRLNRIQLPKGFSISVFAEIPNARSLCLGDKGTLFIGNRDQHNVYASVDADHDGFADSLFVIDTDLNSPNGVAFRNGSLYVAEINRILRYDDIENRLGNPPDPVVVFDQYPGKTHHGWKFIAFGPDGKLYVPVGAPCNECDEKDSIFASITRLDPDGSHMEIFAKGIRNSVGFAWHPDTHELWFTDNGRDNLGDDIPNCELNHAPHQGMHFGYPYCHQGDILDPEFGKGKSCSDYTPPAQKLGPHVAPLGMRFYTGNQFPPEYHNRIFIAQHGSWNRSIPIGYRVMMATVQNNQVTDYEPFATGWLQNDKEVIGRPVDVQVMPDGALLISDDKNGVIYRVTYTG